jgi:hypothetical protein
LFRSRARSIHVGSNLHYAPPDLKPQTTYFFRLRIQYKFGEAPPSYWLQYNTTPAALVVESSPDYSQGVIVLECPPPYDQANRLAQNHVRPRYRLEGRDFKNEWSVLKSSETPRFAIRDVPRNLISAFRYMVTVDLRHVRLPSGERDVETDGTFTKPVAYFWDVAPVTLALSRKSPRCLAAPPLEFSSS